MSVKYFYLKVTIKKKWLTQTFDFLSLLKIFVIIRKASSDKIPGVFFKSFMMEADII